MITVYSVPRTIPKTISLSGQSAAAAAAHEEAVGLKLNRAEAITADRDDLVGVPGSDPSAAGKEGRLNLARVVVLEAEEARRKAVEAGRRFNERAIDHLKSHLGRRWNVNWTAAGFTRGSLALPKNPFSLLLKLRAYFVLNPQHEVASTKVTAEEADALTKDISDTILAEGNAKATRKEARKARDAAFTKLRARLVALRAELAQLLARDDMRWRAFGFARPADRRSPKPVSEVKVRAGGEPGEIIAEWPAAVGAENYRVLRQVETIDAEPIEIGIFTDRTAIIRDLPTDRKVTISVTARNPAGETAPVAAGSIFPT
jgi:hypothetical protein